MPFFVIFRHKFHTFIKHTSTYYIYKVKYLIEVDINFTSEFDHGHGPLTVSMRASFSGTDIMNNY